MVLDKKTNFLIEKPKKQKNKSFGKLYGQTTKRCFLVFPGKKLVFGGKTNFFLGKKMVLGQKTNLGKGWFWTKKLTVSQEKGGFQLKNQLLPRKKMALGQKTNFFTGKTKKKTIFLEFGHIGFPKDVFFVFPRKKLVFQHKTIFFLGKSWFFGPKPSFS